MQTVLDTIRQKHNSQTALDERKEILLEVAQVFDEEIIDVCLFQEEQNVTIGAQVGHRLRFAGQPIAWVPSSFSTLSFLMYPFLQTQDEWRSDFFSIQEQQLISWNNGKAYVHIPSGWRSWFHTEDGQVSIASSDQTVQLLVGQHLIIQGDTEWFSLRYVHPSQSTPRPWISYIDGGSIGIAAAVLLSFITFFYGMNQYQPAPEEENIETVLQMFEATARIREAPMPEEVITVSKNLDVSNTEGKPNKSGAGNKATGQKEGPSGPVSKSKAVADFMSGLDFGGPSDTSSDIIGSTHTIGTIAKGGSGSGGNGIGSIGGWGSAGGGNGSSIDGFGSIGEGGTDRRSGTGGKKITRVRNKVVKTSSSYTILGGLSRSLIDAVIKRNLSQIRYCYQRQLAKEPDLGGKITVKFVISRDGSVARTSIDKTTMNSQKVESCIQNRFMKFTFPKPDGGIVIVKYPFVFQSIQ